MNSYKEKNVGTTGDYKYGARAVAGSSNPKYWFRLLKLAFHSDLVRIFIPGQLHMAMVGAWKFGAGAAEAGFGSNSKQGIYINYVTKVCLIVW